ncbi:MAG: hypothetical protein UX13_C0016G0009 [Candidatus Woesebacteria bacterium GW2011_GWB1_45_5]|uniref:Uncharacterized protein n=1 Tax=Candidatus Woesebacteria bacterium GW2011_GWB1_45_5 TaxID=1618581 RepID=A0A0G1MQ66_9BACT|nr:MAG: hypothetical protein UX13_C0016G0009 [Candidatus Woesebacteria bacterium GW2011_GWB1_45_5]
MSVIERIKQIQQARTEQTAIEKAAKDATALEMLRKTAQQAEKARAKKEQAEKLRPKGEDERQQFVKGQAEKILKGSLALEGLAKINDELLTDGNLILDFENAKVELQWNILSSDDSKSYSFIELIFDPDQETLTIKGKNARKFKSGQLGNRNDIETALTNAFLNPARYSYVKPELEESDWDDRDDRVHGQDSGR